MKISMDIYWEFEMVLIALFAKGHQGHDPDRPGSAKAIRVATLIPLVSQGHQGRDPDRLGQPRPLGL